jgi:Ca2+-binding RTX toxin-like protein
MSGPWFTGAARQFDFPNTDCHIALGLKWQGEMATKNGNDLANVLIGTAAADTINGLGGNDTLWGRASNDILNGGIGADNMRGEAGNDRYYVDNAGDVVTELAGAGTDVIFSSISFNMNVGGRINVEHLTLFGAAVTGIGNALNNSLTGNNLGNKLYGQAGIDRLLGLGGNDTLLGGTGNDVLLGGLGNDILDGGTGADNMRGEAGNDTYYVDGNDRVTELVGGGTDTIISGGGFVDLNEADTLNVENLTLVGLGNGSSDTAFGNALNNVITGTGLLSVLEGRDGNDTLRGLGGGDVMWGGNGNDTLEGGADGDGLNGQAGNDVLKGGAGADNLTGGTGNDRFVFDAPLVANTYDFVGDFVHGQDKIVLENAVFTALPTGPLVASAFRLGPTALDADDRILYDQGALFYDRDGLGGVAPVKFASFGIVPALNAADFLVV